MASTLGCPNAAMRRTCDGGGGNVSIEKLYVSCKWTFPRCAPQCRTSMAATRFRKCVSMIEASTLPPQCPKIGRMTQVCVGCRFHVLPELSRAFLQTIPPHENCFQNRDLRPIPRFLRPKEKISASVPAAVRLHTLSFAHPPPMAHNQREHQHERGRAKL